MAACANSEKAAITVRGRSLWLIGKWRLKGVKAATEVEFKANLELRAVVEPKTGAETTICWKLEWRMALAF